MPEIESFLGGLVSEDALGGIDPRNVFKRDRREVSNGRGIAPVGAFKGSEGARASAVDGFEGGGRRGSHFDGLVAQNPQQAGELIALHPISCHGRLGRHVAHPTSANFTATARGRRERIARTSEVMGT